MSEKIEAGSERSELLEWRDHDSNSEITYTQIVSLEFPDFAQHPETTYSIVRRRMIWNMRPDFGAESSGSSGLGYAA